VKFLPITASPIPIPTEIRLSLRCDRADLLHDVRLEARFLAQRVQRPVTGAAARSRDDDEVLASQLGQSDRLFARQAVVFVDDDAQLAVLDPDHSRAASSWAARLRPRFFRSSVLRGPKA